MLPLNKDLQSPKGSISDFYDLTLRTQFHLQNVLSRSVEKNGYLIYVSEFANSIKYIRPIRKSLYLFNQKELEISFELFKLTTEKIKSRNLSISEEEKKNMDVFLYTIQQTIGAGLDLLVDPNSARKHIGNRFEELIKIVFDEVQISNKKLVLSIPYPSEQGEKIYKCENDLIVSPYSEVLSNSFETNEKEIVISIKTTSKDRMGKIFIDKLLIEKFVNHPQKVIGIFNNDVQRKEGNNISFTLVSGLFMVYTKFLTELEGVYYLDPPPITKREPFKTHMKPFSELITKDIFELLIP